MPYAYLVAGQRHSTSCSLAAYSGVVLGRLCDMVSLCVRNLLVSEVRRGRLAAARPSGWQAGWLAGLCLQTYDLRLDVRPSQSAI